MDGKRLVIAVLTALALVAGGAQLVRADIDSTTPNMVAVPAPPTVQLGAAESSTDILVFEERQGVTLAAAVVVDITADGSYTSNAELTPGEIAAGTTVCSHLVHFDPVGTANVTEQGRVTFDGAILGVMVLDAALDASDTPLGAAGTAYPIGLPDRGLELDQPRDRIVVDGGQRRISVFLRANTVLDHVRVLTDCPPAPEYVYNVKFVCGINQSPSLHAAIVTPGIYATDVNIANPHPGPADLAKRVIPLVADGVGPLREPESGSELATDGMVLPGLHATMDDCWKISALLQPGSVPPSIAALPLTVGFLEIRSPVAVDVTVVYTSAHVIAPGTLGGRSTLEVEQVEAMVIGG